MNKIASDLKNFAPEAPLGMEERIQSALSKKKSFWAFSWYTLNIYVVALVGAGILALVFSNRSEGNVIAQSAVPAAMEVVVNPSAFANMNSNSQEILIEEKVTKTTPSKTTRKRKIVQVVTSASDVVVENCQTTVIEAAIANSTDAQVAESVEIQKKSEEIQVPKSLNGAVKPKGRPLRLTRLTGK